MNAMDGIVVRRVAGLGGQTMVVRQPDLPTLVLVDVSADVSDVFEAWLILTAEEQDGPLTYVDETA